MMNMGVSNKVKAQLHVLVGLQPISISFESDDAARREWIKLTKMLETPQSAGAQTVIHHDQGSVWIALIAVTACSWTKEQRQTLPTGAVMAPANFRPSN